MTLAGACRHLPAGQEAGDAAAIRDVIEAQQAAWNGGDIDAFMAGYWQSEDLRFASGGSVTRGWQATRDRYHRRYVSVRAMGQLAFEDLEISVLSHDSAVIHGRWQLERETDSPSGLFTLIARKTDGRWQIVSDTTTSAD